MEPRRLSIKEVKLLAHARNEFIKLNSDTKSKDLESERNKFILKKLLEGGHDCCLKDVEYFFSVSKKKLLEKLKDRLGNNISSPSTSSNCSTYSPNEKRNLIKGSSTEINLKNPDDLKIKNNSDKLQVNSELLKQNDITNKVNQQQIINIPSTDKTHLTSVDTVFPEKNIIVKAPLKLSVSKTLPKKIITPLKLSVSKSPQKKDITHLQIRDKSMLNSDKIQSGHKTNGEEIKSELKSCQFSEKVTSTPDAKAQNTQLTQIPVLSSISEAEKTGSNKSTSASKPTPKIVDSKNLDTTKNLNSQEGDKITKKCTPSKLKKSNEVQSPITRSNQVVAVNETLSAKKTLAEEIKTPTSDQFSKCIVSKDSEVTKSNEYYESGSSIFKERSNDDKQMQSINKQAADTSPEVSKTPQTKAFTKTLSVNKTNRLGKETVCEETQSSNNILIKEIKNNPRLPERKNDVSPIKQTIVNTKLGEKKSTNECENQLIKNIPFDKDSYDNGSNNYKSDIKHLRQKSKLVKCVEKEVGNVKAIQNLNANAKTHPKPKSSQNCEPLNSNKEGMTSDTHLNIIESKVIEVSLDDSEKKEILLKPVERKEKKNANANNKNSLNFTIGNKDKMSKTLVGTQKKCCNIEIENEKDSHKSNSNILINNAECSPKVLDSEKTEHETRALKNITQLNLHIQRGLRSNHDNHSQSVTYPSIKEPVSNVMKQLNTSDSDKEQRIISSKVHNESLHSKQVDSLKVLLHENEDGIDKHCKTNEIPEIQSVEDNSKSNVAPIETKDLENTLPNPKVKSKSLAQQRSHEEVNCTIIVKANSPVPLMVKTDSDVKGNKVSTNKKRRKFCLCNEKQCTCKSGNDDKVSQVGNVRTTRSKSTDLLSPRKQPVQVKCPRRVSIRKRQASLTVEESREDHDSKKRNENKTRKTKEEPCKENVKEITKLEKNDHNNEKDYLKCASRDAVFTDMINQQISTEIKQNNIDFNPGNETGEQKNLRKRGRPKVLEKNSLIEMKLTVNSNKSNETNEKTDVLPNTFGGISEPEQNIIENKQSNGIDNHKSNVKIATEKKLPKKRGRKKTVGKISEKETIVRVDLQESKIHEQYQNETIEKKDASLNTCEENLGMKANVIENKYDITIDKCNSNIQDTICNTIESTNVSCSKNNRVEQTQLQNIPNESPVNNKEEVKNDSEADKSGESVKNSTVIKVKEFAKNHVNNEIICYTENSGQIDSEFETKPEIDCNLQFLTEEAESSINSSVLQLPISGNESDNSQSNINTLALNQFTPTKALNTYEEGQVKVNTTNKTAEIQNIKFNQTEEDDFLYLEEQPTSSNNLHNGDPKRPFESCDHSDLMNINITGSDTNSKDVNSKRISNSMKRNRASCFFGDTPCSHKPDPPKKKRQSMIALKDSDKGSTTGIPGIMDGSLSELTSVPHPNTRNHTNRDPDYRRPMTDMRRNYMRARRSRMQKFRRQKKKVANDLLWTALKDIVTNQGTDKTERHYSHHIKNERYRSSSGNNNRDRYNKHCSNRDRYIPDYNNGYRNKEKSKTSRSTQRSSEEYRWTESVHIWYQPPDSTGIKVKSLVKTIKRKDDKMPEKSKPIPETVIQDNKNRNAPAPESVADYYPSCGETDHNPKTENVDLRTERSLDFPPPFNSVEAGDHFGSSDQRRNSSDDTKCSFRNPSPPPFNPIANSCSSSTPTPRQGSDTQPDQNRSLRDGLVSADTSLCQTTNITTDSQRTSNNATESHSFRFAAKQRRLKQNRSMFLANMKKITSTVSKVVKRQVKLENNVEEIRKELIKLANKTN